MPPHREKHTVSVVLICDSGMPAVVTNDSKATVAVLIGMVTDKPLTFCIGVGLVGQDLNAPCLGQRSPRLEGWFSCLG